MLGRTSSLNRGSERYVTRRRSRRRQVLIGLLILLVLLAAGALFELRQDTFRISHVQIYGADQSYADIAYTAMQGWYLGIIPHDSTFFFPENRIRADIMKAHPDISAVSFFLNGFTTLSIKVSERDAISRWCGLAPTPDVSEYCYLFDANGLVFAAESTSTPTINSFKLYDPLEGNTQEPLGATLAHADILPHVFEFARQLNTLGSPVTHIVIKDDEVHQYLKSGTRITYVLGNEQDAYTALVSSKENFNLADGSIDYIDLRFDGKVYVKRK